MSRRKRAIEKQKKQNSKARKLKQQRKAYYASGSAIEKWEEKKARKSQSQLNNRISKGISSDCPLFEWEKPSAKKCEDCSLKCSFKRQ